MLELVLIMLVLTQQYRITIDKSDHIYNVVDNGIVDSRFDQANLKQSQCHPSTLYGETANIDKTQFNIENDSNEVITIKLSPISRYTNSVRLTTDSNTLTIKPNSTSTYTINYQCVNSQDTTWSVIDVEISIGSLSLNINYFKLCQQPEQYMHPLLILVVLAISLVIIGSWYGQRQLSLFGEAQQEEMGLMASIFFIGFASIMLIVLFKFPNIGQYVLLVWISIISLISMETLICELLQQVSSHHKCNTIIGYFCGSFVVIAYIMSKNWMLNNILALTNTLLMFRIIEMDSFRTCTVLLILAFFYDIFWVFISPHFFGESVMATVATTIDLPMKFTCPTLIHLLNTPILKCSLLGLGDILLPGIMIKYILKYEMMLNKGRILFITAIIAYSIGLGICIASLLIYNTAQPALLYIVPCTLIAITVMSYYRNQLDGLWKGEIIHVGSSPRIEHGYELTAEVL